MGPQDFLLFDDIRDDTIGDAPADEVELRDGGREPLELDALRAAEGVEELLGVAIQAALVGHMDREYLAVRRRETHVTGFGVVGHKPLQISEGNSLAMAQDIVQLLRVSRLAEKPGQTLEQNIRFTHYKFWFLNV